MKKIHDIYDKYVRPLESTINELLKDFKQIVTRSVQVLMNILK